jgi:hypothetical protein
MKKRLIIISFFTLLVGFCNAKIDWYPDDYDVKLLDSIVLSELIKSQCYDSNETYKIFYLFNYEYIIDTLRKSDFTSKSLTSKLMVSYFSFPENASVDISNSLSKMTNRTTEIITGQENKDYIQSQKLQSNTDGLQVKNPIQRKCLAIDEAFIFNSSNELIGTWSTYDNWISCNNPDIAKIWNFYDELSLILMRDEFEIIFHLLYTAGGNYVAVDKNGELTILTFSRKTNNGVRRVSVEELVTDYWKEYDLFRLDP